MRWSWNPLSGIGPIPRHLRSQTSNTSSTSRRDDLIVTNCDLGENVAINMAGDGVIKGLSAQRPYDQGVTEAMLAGYGLLGKSAPAYVALPALPVTKANLADAWSQVYHKPVTDKIKKSM